MAGAGLPQSITAHEPRLLTKWMTNTVTREGKGERLCVMDGSLNRILDWAVVVLPTLLSIVGVLVTLEPWDKKHRTKWRVGLIFFGIMVSSLTYWQQAKQRVRADGDAREFREQMVREERDNTEKFNELMERFKSVVAQTSREHKPAPIATIHVPTAEEIASAVRRQLKEAEPPSIPPHTSDRTTATNSVPAPVVVTPVNPLPTTQQCRGDRLSECSDEQLLQWGEPLVANIEAIANNYMADLKKLDDIKGGNWFGGLIGIGDKDSKWMKGYAQAQETAADHFRDCCAENALVYDRELAQRTGGGLEKNEIYEWIEHLMKPIRSKEWKNARQDAGKIVDLVFDLKVLQINLTIAPVKRSTTLR